MEKRLALCPASDLFGEHFFDSKDGVFKKWDENDERTVLVCPECAEDWD